MRSWLIAVAVAFFSSGVRAQNATSVLMRPPTDDELLRFGGVDPAINNFEEFQRQPIEGAQNFVPLGASPEPLSPGLVAYFRDIAVVALTFAEFPDNGDTWTASLGFSDGSLSRSFDTISFHTTFQPPTGPPRNNCFVNNTTGQFQCDATSIVIGWVTQAQCAPTGTWTWSFLYDNALAFPVQTHLLLPRLPPGHVGLTRQFDPSWKLDPYDHDCWKNLSKLSTEPCYPAPTGTQVQANIWERGCLETAVVNALVYQGVAVDPGTYNDAARTLGPDGLDVGYQPGGDMDFDFAQTFASANGKVFVWQGAHDDPLDLGFDTDKALLDRAVCSGGAQIIKVFESTPPDPPTKHFVTLAGRELAEDLFVVSDPEQGGFTGNPAAEVGYNGHALSAQFFGSVFVASLDSFIVFEAFSPVELLLTDPSGKRLGVDASGAHFHEIAGSSYGEFGLDNGATGVDDPDPEKRLTVYGALDGTQTLQVTGTGTGTYSLRMTTMTTDKKKTLTPVVSNVPIAPGVVNVYQVDYAKAPGSTNVVIGGFDGHGQRPKDVNKFLTYVTPTAPKTTLAAGSTTASLVIAYGPTTIPGTFTAVLNGTNVASTFHPSPGQVEQVVLPVVGGTNSLKLSIQGSLPSRVATDSDTLSFVVP